MTPLQKLNELRQNNKDHTNLFNDELLDSIEEAIKVYEARIKHLEMRVELRKTVCAMTLDNCELKNQLSRLDKLYPKCKYDIEFVRINQFTKSWWFIEVTER